MFNALAISSIYVLDQQQALDFYVGKLGLEVNTDQDLGFMRWLTVNVPGDSRQILLEKPGPPAQDPKTAERIRELVTKGATGGHLFFTTTDARKHMRNSGRKASRSPRSRPSGTTASTAGCATRSAITSDSCSRFRSLPQRSTGGRGQRSPLPLAGDTLCPAAEGGTIFISWGRRASPSSARRRRTVGRP